MANYMDKTLSPEKRAELLLAEMTLDEKMAQVNCAFPYSTDLDTSLKMAQHKAPQGTGHVSTLIMRDLKTLEDAVRFQQELQRQAMKQTPHHIPAIFHMEGLCGAYLQGAASFPSGYARGASWDPVLEREIGAVVGRQERSVGITQTLAPVLDISRDQRMGRCAETYGEDPALAASLGAAYAGGLAEEETAGLRSEGAAKHFLGFHASEGGMDVRDLYQSAGGSGYHRQLLRKPVLSRFHLVRRPAQLLWRRHLPVLSGRGWKRPVRRRQETVPGLSGVHECLV